ncbi:MAG: hypothetical protein DRH32_03800 [Deltaproteobacteria bacterium]|nr:MAG: hypothetical protein DRH32_03800 [Deltaproteobacteria bacterium]
MIMGPAPIIRILWISVRLGIIEYLCFKYSVFSDELSSFSHFLLSRALNQIENRIPEVVHPLYS